MRASQAAKPVAGLLLLAGLYLTSLYSYNLFHSLVECFSVVVAAGVFVIAWNAKAITTNAYVVFLGSALIFVAGVDLLHTLAYEGLAVFPGYDTDLPTQLWLAGRYLHVLALLVAPFLIARRMQPYRYVAGWGALTAVLVALIFTEIFPSAYVMGQGLTSFKLVSEYAICLLLVAAFWLLYRKRAAFEPQVFVLLALSIFTTIASELLFTLYTSPFGPANLAGHLFKLVTFYLIYKAVIQTALVRPYALLFRELKQSEQHLREEERQQRHIADVLQEALLTTPESIAGLEFGHLYRPATVAGKVGGDFYDLFLLGHRSVGVLIGDVSGHGLEAAAYTSLARDTVKAFALAGQAPGQALAEANLVMLQTATGGEAGDRAGGRFLTAFYAILDLNDGTMRYSAAGHPPGIIRRKTGEVELLEVTAPIVGVFPAATYGDAVNRLDYGDTLFLYTDGLTECRAGKEFFGEERLRDLLATLSTVPASQLPTRLYEEVKRFSQGDLADDLAILALSPKAEATEPDLDDVSNGTS